MKTTRGAVLFAAAGAAVAAVTLARCSDSGDDPCAGVDCSSRGFCVADQGAAYCACIRGHHPSLRTCVPNDPANPCLGVDCGSHGTCWVNGTNAGCACDPAYEYLLDATTPQCAEAECDLTCVPLEGAPPACVEAECDAFCLGLAPILDGRCMLGYCACLPTCDVVACINDCSAAGHLTGTCDGTNCVCLDV
jgi:hypothetical protein